MVLKPSSINQLTGTIYWEKDSHNSVDSGEELPLWEPSPIFLKLQVERDELVVQERKGFRNFDDLAAARASRERQVVIYPRMTEETDGSKLVRKQVRAAEREEKREAIRVRKEFQPVANPATGKIKWS